MDFVFTIILAFVVVITMYTVIKVKNKLAMKDIDCKKSMIKNNEYRLAEANFDDDDSLKDYYVMTAYNCCSVKKDWVDLCALSHCIKLGCRCLDFEIFEHDNVPVVGTTSSNDGIRDSFNYIKLNNVLSKIMEEAFSLRYTNLYKDPLIVNFRIKVISEDFYNKVAKVIEENKVKNVSRYLDSKGDVLLDKSMNSLKKKIILMSSDIKKYVLNRSSLGDYLNLIGEKAPSNFWQVGGSCGISLNVDNPLLQVNDTNLLDNEESIHDLKIHSMNNYLKISIPDDIIGNPKYCYHKKAEINYIGMSFKEMSGVGKFFQNVSGFVLRPPHLAMAEPEDLLKFEELGNLNNYIQWFNDNNSAFIKITDDKHKITTNNYNSCNSNIMFDDNYRIMVEKNTYQKKNDKVWYNNLIGKLI